MKVTRLPDAEPRPRRVAVGTFDGVHLGHREVIRGADTVLTFDPHPRAVVSPQSVPPLLTTLDRKAELVAGLGVQELVVVPFDEGFAHQSAQDFVDEVLVGTLAATHVAVGENFRFGHKAQGDPFQMRGEVVHGDGRGRELGYPTANLVPDPRFVTPGHGVYAGRAHGHAAAVNVGVRPQFVTGRGELVEAFLIDFEGDLYGQELRVNFLKRLRGERRFDSVDALVAQMARDVDQARALA